MEWSTDTKTGYDDLEVYMEYGYVLVSSTGRNNVKMAAFSFKIFIKKRSPLYHTHHSLIPCPEDKLDHNWQPI